KLADHTQHSVKQISSLLSEIHHRITAAYRHVEIGNQAMIRSGEALLATTRAVQETKSNSVLAAKQTEGVSEMTTELMEEFVKLSQRMSDITQTTQQNMTAIEEVNANIDQQSAQMQEISDQYQQLDTLISELHEMLTE